MSCYTLQKQNGRKLVTWPLASSGEDVPSACDMYTQPMDGTQVTVAKNLTLEIVETPQPRLLLTESVWSLCKNFYNNRVKAMSPNDNPKHNCIEKGKPHFVSQSTNEHRRHVPTGRIGAVMVYHPEDVNHLNYKLRFYDGEMPEEDWVAEADCEEADAVEVDVTYVHGPRPADRQAGGSAVGSPSVVDQAPAEMQGNPQGVPSTKAAPCCIPQKQSSLRGSDFFEGDALPPPLDPPADDEAVIHLKRMAKSMADQSCLVFSSDNTKHHIRFTADAKKLKGNHKEIHSPAFEVRFGLIWVHFIIMIYPTVTNDRVKGGASFRAATGHGNVQLKCEVARPNSKRPGELKGSSAELQDDVRWQVGISNPTQNRENVEMRGPVRFSFAQENVVSRLENDRGWDFRTAVDPSSQTFVICLEIMRD